MDYQRNGWFRPTGGFNRQSPAAPVSHRSYSAAASNRSQPTAAAARPAYSSAIPRVVDAPSLAMVYSPCQKWQQIYDPVKALSRGTQFAELDKPFAGGRC